MALVNENFLRLAGNYLFAEIAQRVSKYKAAHPSEHVISLGIGDVTRPLAPAVVEAMTAATHEMGTETGMHGYPPYYGYNFLVDAIVSHDFAARGIDITADEIHVNDGAKSDTGNIGDILGTTNSVAVTDPVYPVYVDSNVIAGRSGSLIDGRYSDITYLPCTPANGFVPELPARHVDIVYLCYPNNPTGTVLTRDQLKIWVDYARNNRSLLLYDAAYEAFISDDKVPHSIFEIEGAREVAIEFRSFSKTAGFTGVRCGYTVIPKEVKAYTANGEGLSLNELWKRRQATKFNGTGYIVQRGAAAVYSPEGHRQIRETIDYYLGNAKIIKNGLEKAGLTVYGGVNAPYIWLQTPNNKESWAYFDYLLNNLQVVTTPGSGFGQSGEGFVRLTAFGRRDETIEAVERICKAPY